MDYWKSFRKRVENEYRLHCKEMLWKICDERGVFVRFVCLFAFFLMFFQSANVRSRVWTRGGKSKTGELG